MQAE
jgi:hypothetical protein